MAFLVACYIGETRRETRPHGFSSYRDALRFLHEVQTDSLADGFRVSGDPLDGTLTILDGEHRETYVLSETSDPEHLRRAVYG